MRTYDIRSCLPKSDVENLLPEDVSISVDTPRVHLYSGTGKPEIIAKCKTFIYEGRSP